MGDMGDVENIRLDYVTRERGRPQTRDPRARGPTPAHGEMRRLHRTPLTGLPLPNAEKVVLEPVTFSAAFSDSGLTPRVVVQALQAATPEQFLPRFALHLPPVPIGEVGRRGVGLAFRSGKRYLVGKEEWSRILAASGGENSLDSELVDAVTRAMLDPAGMAPLARTMMVLLDRDHAEMERAADAAAAAGNGAALERLRKSCADGQEMLNELVGNAHSLSMIMTIATGAADEEGLTQVRMFPF